MEHFHVILMPSSSVANFNRSMKIISFPQSDLEYEKDTLRLNGKIRVSKHYLTGKTIQFRGISKPVVITFVTNKSSIFQHTENLAPVVILSSEQQINAVVPLKGIVFTNK